MEIINMDPAVKQCIRTLKSMDTPTILSQFALEIMVNPPAPGDASYQTYTQVRTFTVITEKDSEAGRSETGC